MAETAAASLKTPVIGRMCDRAGLDRRSADLYDAVREEARVYMAFLVSHAKISAAHGGRRAIALCDAAAGVEAAGQTPMGFRP